MNDEIEEILNDLQRVADRKCYPEDILDGSIAQEWVDYITNLQERIDKAIEYINNCPEYLWANVNTKELKNILQGEDNDKD